MDINFKTIFVYRLIVAMTSFQYYIELRSLCIICLKMVSRHMAIIAGHKSWDLWDCQWPVADKSINSGTDRIEKLPVRLGQIRSLFSSRSTSFSEQANVHTVSSSQFPVANCQQWATRSRD